MMTLVPRLVRTLLLSAMASVVVAALAAEAVAAEKASAAEKTAPTKAQAAKAEAAEEEKPDTPAERPECRFVGVKMVRVMLRDDLIAAEGFNKFYGRFDCPTEHLGHALGCAAPAARVEDAAELQRHVEACWGDPSVELHIRAPVKPTPQEGEANGSPRAPRSGAPSF